MMRKWTKWGLCAVAVFAVAGCASTGGGKGVSDEDAIKAVIDSVLAGLQAQDIAAMTANYAEDFKSDQGGGKPEMVEFLTGAKDQGFLEGIKVGLDKLTTTIDGEKATVEPIELEGSFGVLTLSFNLEKREGAWVIVYQAQF